MQSRTRVLIIDDEYKTLEILGMRLSQDGFEVTTATTGEAGLKLAYETHPDAILLDIIMPGIDGFKVCRRLREVTDAVIMLVSVKGDSDDVIRGLHSGADDYIVKPYNYLELLARLYACLRRRADAKLPPLRLQRGEAVLITDPSRRLVFINDGRSVQLTPKEFELLRYLVKNQGRVLSADAILSNVWGPEYKGERDLVKQFIYRLRNKLEADPSKPEYIVTVRGSGYAFEEDTRPTGLKKAVPTPRRQTEALPPLQAVKPLVVPEGAEPTSWAAQALPRELASRALHPGESEAQGRARRKRRTWVRRIAAALSLAVLVTLGATFASGYALPGDALYPVKSLVEDVQHTLAKDEVSLAHLHIQLAETRLKEADSLMKQGRYEDIPAAMNGYEREMRLATWELLRFAGGEDRYGKAVALVLEKRVESQAEMLNNLVSNAPSEARPAIDHAINVLTAETATWQAFFIEISPSTVSDEMVVIDDRESRGDERNLKETPEFPDLPEVITRLQSNAEDRIADVLPYPWESDGFLPGNPVVPTQVALPLPISTAQPILNAIATTRPASNQIPSNQDSSFPPR
ncbi:MAG TPA: response regulator transcription factor [Anaerolineae bacterium]|nr:response regulator transcription factor [Anaerolineae bacterium]